MILKNIDLLIIAGYFIVLIIIGFFRNNTEKSSQNDYIINGRKLSLPGFIATLVSTWYGAILGIGENTYMYGIQTWFIFAFPYYIFAGVYAIWLSEKICKTNLLSIPDIFRRNYGHQTGIISACLILILSSPAPYILSLGILLKFLFNIELIICLIIASIFSTVYLWNGGFSSIVNIANSLSVFRIFLAIPLYYSVNNMNTKLEFIIADIMDYQFDRDFDTIFALGVVEYFEDPESLIDVLRNIVSKRILNSSAHRKGSAPNLNNGLSQPISIPNQIIPRI